MTIACNIGTADRIARFVLGAALLVLGISGLVSDVAALVAATVGVIFLITAIARHCPLYTAIGLDTCGPRPRGSM